MSQPTARTAVQIADGLKALRPTGEILWDRDDGYVAATYQPWAAELALIEAQGLAMQLEIDPRTAVNCFDAFQRVLGSDPCGLDQLAPNEAALVGLVYSRWIAGGNMCAGTIISFCAGLGITATVQEYSLPELGLWTVGVDAVDQAPSQAYFTVTLSGAGLLTYPSPVVECAINRMAPAHTQPLYAIG